MAMYLGNVGGKQGARGGGAQHLDTSALHRSTSFLLESAPAHTAASLSLHACNSPSSITRRCSCASAAARSTATSSAPPPPAAAEERSCCNSASAKARAAVMSANERCVLTLAQLVTCAQQVGDNCMDGPCRTQTGTKKRDLLRAHAKAQRADGLFLLHLAGADAHHYASARVAAQRLCNAVQSRVRAALGCGTACCRHLGGCA